MKKILQFVVIVASILAILWIARNNPVWARQSPSSSVGGAAVNKPADVQGMPVVPVSEETVNFSPQANKVSITQAGVYYVGGLCMLDISYKLATGLRDEVDVDVPLEKSRQVTFGYQGDIYLPGCHLVHYKNEQVTPVMGADDGNWKLCFAERPDVTLTVYYYPDESPTSWIELPTTHENGLACASAIFTGEYAPGMRPVETQGPDGGGGQDDEDGGNNGTVQPPPSSITITGSGTYLVGGICSIIVRYDTQRLSEQVHVQDPIEQDPIDDSNGIPFPYDGLLYLPGCHVLHYKNGEITHWEVDPLDGEWKICFAARPDKEMTIYYYLGDLVDRESDWLPLESVTENGMVCAPANFTGMYAPAGK